VIGRIAGISALVLAVGITACAPVGPGRRTAEEVNWAEMQAFTRRTAEAYGVAVPFITQDQGWCGTAARSMMVGPSDLAAFHVWQERLIVFCDRRIVLHPLRLALLAHELGHYLLGHHGHGGAGE
jgi:hypothetical protein